MVAIILLSIALLALYITSRESVNSLSPEVMNLCRKAYLFLKLKKYREALRIYSAALELKPDCLEALANRGNAHYYLGEHEEALEDYSQAIEIRPSFSIAFNNLGNTYLAMGQLEEAIDDFSQAVELDPQFPEAFYNRAEAYSEKGEMELALADYNRASDLNPANENVLFRRASLLLKSDDYRQLALTDLDSLIEQNDKHSRAWYLRGLYYYEQGDYQKAIEDFSRTIDLNPLSFRALYRRGVCYFEQGDYQKAIEDFSRTIDLNPHYYLASYRRGILFLNIKEYHQAFTDFSRVIEVSSLSFRAYAFRALSRQGMGDLEGAREDLEVYFSGEEIGEDQEDFLADMNLLERHLKRRNILDEELNAELEMEDMGEDRVSQPERAKGPLEQEQDEAVEPSAEEMEESRHSASDYEEDEEEPAEDEDESAHQENQPAQNGRKVIQDRDDAVNEIINLFRDKSEKSLK